MKKTNFLGLSCLSLMFALAGIAAAQGPVANDNTTSSELTMNTNVQTSVQLNISTGTGGSTVSGSNATGLFSVDFGNVNGLGTGTPDTGIAVLANGTGARYTTAINLTPVYSGFTTESADIDVSAGSSGDEDLAIEGDTAANATGVGAPRSAGTGLASDSNNERIVGFFIPRTEPAGAKSATLVYTITVQ